MIETLVYVMVSYIHMYVRAKTHKTRNGKEDTQTHTGMTKTKTHKNSDTKNPRDMRGKTNMNPTGSRAKSHAESRAKTNNTQDKPGQARAGTETQQAKDADPLSGAHKTHADPRQNPTRELAMEDKDGCYHNTP